MAFGRTATPLEHLLVSRRRLRRLSLISLQTGTPYFLNPTASRPLIFRETIKSAIVAVSALVVAIWDEAKYHFVCTEESSNF